MQRIGVLASQNAVIFSGADPYFQNTLYLGLEDAR